MASDLWIFGYGSLIWNPGFNHSKAMIGHIKGYSRKFYQGSDVHRGRPDKVSYSTLTIFLHFSLDSSGLLTYCITIKGNAITDHLFLYLFQLGRVVTLMEDKEVCLFALH